MAVIGIAPFVQPAVSVLIRRSLQAAWIRNNILRSLDNTGRTVDLPPNFVYQALSISALARLISNAVTVDASQGPVPSGDDRAQQLLELVARFTANFPTRPSTVLPRPVGKDVILLTGSTGAFGCHILAELLIDPSVEKVYVLNKGLRSRDRQLANMRRRCVDVAARQVSALHAQGADFHFHRLTWCRAFGAKTGCSQSRAAIGWALIGVLNCSGGTAD